MREGAVQEFLFSTKTIKREKKAKFLKNLSFIVHVKYKNTFFYIFFSIN